MRLITHIVHGGVKKLQVSLLIVMDSEPCQLHLLLFVHYDEISIHLTLIALDRQISWKEHPHAYCYYYIHMYSCLGGKVACLHPIWLALSIYIENSLRVSYNTLVTHNFQLQQNKLLSGILEPPYFDYTVPAE
jgi:hypothetical protein